MEEVKIGVFLDDGAYNPLRGHSADAGLDLRTPTYVNVGAGESVEVDTRVRLYIPIGYAGLMVPKSGLDNNHNTFSFGLIDSGYTGTIRVKLHNMGTHQVDLLEGSKVAQVMIVKLPRVSLCLYDGSTDDERGDGGFGSTGR